MIIKKVITPVGASIFENYMKQDKKDIDSLYEAITDKLSKEYNEKTKKIKMIKTILKNHYENKLNINISAEIKTISKIHETLKEDLDVYLLASDTLVSVVAAELIKEFLEEFNFKVFFRKDVDTVEGLQVLNKKDFIRSGLHNLIKRVEEISEGYYKNVLFNISGGYKVTIPYLTVMAQINSCDMYYIFEEHDELIKIPSVPIVIDDEIFSNHYNKFKELEKGIENFNEWKEKNYTFVNEVPSCIESDEEIAFLSPLGSILWEKYKSNIVEFYTTDEVIIKVKKNFNLLVKLVQFLSEVDIRDSKTELKGSYHKHKIFDDGNNPYRIAYIEEDENMFVYAIFDNEEEQQRFLNDKNKSNKKEDYKFNTYLLDKKSQKIKDLNGKIII